MTEFIDETKPIKLKDIKKKTEFKKRICNDGTAGEILCIPLDFSIVKLIMKTNRYDFMLGTDSDGENPCLYFGHWNDGC